MNKVIISLAQVSAADTRVEPAEVATPKEVCRILNIKPKA
jgi:hypothetical protein